MRVERAGKPAGARDGPAVAAKFEIEFRCRDSNLSAMAGDRVNSSPMLYFASWARISAGP